MRQTWANLLFLHWRFPAAVVQRTLPPGLFVDTHEDAAWVGVVPFYMRKVRPRAFPAIGGLSNFLELNVRTYVYNAAGEPGVWFYSLDCNQPLAVRIARSFFYLPYEHARMSSVIAADAMVHYTSRRIGTDVDAMYEYRAAPGPASEARAGSLEFFLVERYRLFAYDPKRGRLLSGRVFHRPYQVSDCVTPVWSDAPMTQCGFDSEGRPPDHRCVANPVDVDVFALAEERVEPA